MVGARYVRVRGVCEDSYLKGLINDALCANACSYCGRSNVVPIAAEANDVFEAVYDTVHTYYCEPASGGVPCDGGFIIEPIDIEEVLDNLGFDGHSDFVKAVIDAEVNGDSFVPAADGNWAGSPTHEVLSSAWRSFGHSVKHETRFHFAEMPRAGLTSPYEMEVADVLPAIAERLRPLIRTLAIGTNVYRVRVRYAPEVTYPIRPDARTAPQRRQERRRKAAGHSDFHAMGRHTLPPRLWLPPKSPKTPGRFTVGESMIAAASPQSPSARSTRSDKSPYDPRRGKT